MTTPDTIRIFVPLEYRRRNGRTQILPPENRLDAEDRQQDPHILRALARAWEWRRKLEIGEVNTVSDLAATESLSDRFVSRQIRIAYLAPAVIERMMVKQEIPAVKIANLINIAAKPWREQECAVFDV
jgi:hypothetical protein